MSSTIQSNIDTKRNEMIMDNKSSKEKMQEYKDKIPKQINWQVFRYKKKNKRIQALYIAIQLPILTKGNYRVIFDNPYIITILYFL